jgi:hypothetical protein
VILPSFKEDHMRNMVRGFGGWFLGCFGSVLLASSIMAAGAAEPIPARSQQGSPPPLANPATTPGAKR